MITKQKLVDEEEDRRSIDSAASTVVEQEKDEADATRRNEPTLPPPVTANEQQPISQQSIPPTSSRGRLYASLQRQWSRRWFKIIIIGVALAILIVVICTSVILLTRRHAPPPRNEPSSNNSTQPNNGTSPPPEDACWRSMQNSSQYIDSVNSHTSIALGNATHIYIKSEVDWIDGSFTIKPADSGKQNRAEISWTTYWSKPDLKNALQVVTSSKTDEPSVISLTSSITSDSLQYNSSECVTLVRADVVITIPWSSQTNVLPWTEIRTVSMKPHQFPITILDLGNAGTVFEQLEISTISGDITVQKVTVDGHAVVTSQDGDIEADFVVLDGSDPYVSSQNGNVSLEAANAPTT